MAHCFDDDPSGAILEYGVLLKSRDENRRKEWARMNLKGPYPHLWRSRGLRRLELSGILGNGRDKKHVEEVLVRVLAALERNGLIEPDPRDLDVSANYRVVNILGRKLIQEDSHRDYIGGPPVVAGRWKRSVVRVVHAKGHGIGTGFLVARNLVATAKHVVDELRDFVVQTQTGEKFKHVRVIPPKRKNLDLVLIELEREIDGVASVRLGQGGGLLDEVVVLGFPRVPRSRNADLVANRGEVCSHVKTFDGFDAIIISCLLRGGNSGSPVLNRRGQVVGVVSRLLYEKINFEQSDLNDGIGFAAALPSGYLQELMSGKV